MREPVVKSTRPANSGVSFPLTPTLSPRRGRTMLRLSTPVNATTDGREPDVPAAGADAAR
jgi:hypothetical protein